MNNTLKKALTLSLAVCMGGTLAAGFAGCNRDSGVKVEGDPQALSADSYEEELLTQNDGAYNANLFYVNTLDFHVADPSVIYITEGPEKGYFYAYGTSDDINCHGIQSWRSKDLTHWESMGVAFQPDFNKTWADSNYWAPEVFYDASDGYYYMTYSAERSDTGHMAMSVAYSKYPNGPFVVADGRKNAYGETLSADQAAYDFTPGNSRIDSDIVRLQAIDSSFFVDPVSGKKYMYFSYYDSFSQSEIFGCEMKDWFTPDYSTLKQLTAVGYLTVEAGKNHDETKTTAEGTINEGPFMWYKDGTYYLTLSVYGFQDEKYNVRQALSDDPLGTFEKVPVEEGGSVLSTDLTWTHITSAGHHSFVQCGDELFVAYHTFYNRLTIKEGRSLAVDRVTFVENDKGQEVMYTNGPTYSVQPLPEMISGYKNIASSAKVSADNTASGSDVSLLTDGIVKTRESDIAEEYTAQKGTSTISLKWDEPKTARAVLVYNSYAYEDTFVQIDKIELTYQSGKNTYKKVYAEDIQYDWDWYADTSLEQMKPAAAAVFEFADLPVVQIDITIRSAGGSDSLAISEIAVLGKDEACDPVSEIGAYSYTNPDFPSPEIVNHSATFGDVSTLKTMWGYDLSHDDGTENAYIEQKGNFDQFAYFKDIYSTTFYVEAEITVTNSKPFASDEFPKFGIQVSCDENTIFFYVDADTSYTQKRVGCAQRTLDNSDWDWSATERLYDVQNMSYSNGSYVKMAVLRQGSTFYYYINDQLIVSYNQFNVFTERQQATCGFLSFNTGMKIRKYSATQDAAEVERIRGELPSVPAV